MRKYNSLSTWLSLLVLENTNSNCQNGSQYKETYTFPEASPLSAQYLACSESPIVHLHTADSTTEIPPVTNTSSHSCWVVSGESYSPNIFTRCKSFTDKQLRSSCPSVVRRTDKLPFLRYHLSTYHCFSETASSTTSEPCKQRSGRDHPKVHAPAISLVVEDGPRASLMVNPGQESD